MNINENINEEFINKYHQIYIDIFSDRNKNPDENKQIIVNVKRFIAFSITGETKYATNFLFNLGRLAANGKSTISKMYQKIYKYIGLKLVKMH